MWIYALIPFGLQALVIACDEWIFHHKRGLPKWERIGHPLDTLSLLICSILPLWLPFNSFNLKLYIALSAVSCLMVTKDEFVHKEHCPGAAGPHIGPGHRVVGVKHDKVCDRAVGMDHFVDRARSCGAERVAQIIIEQAGIVE